MARQRYETSVKPADVIDQVLSGADRAVETVDRDTRVSATTNTMRDGSVTIEDARDRNQEIIDRKNKDYV